MQCLICGKIAHKSSDLCVDCLFEEGLFTRYKKGLKSQLHQRFLKAKGVK